MAIHNTLKLAFVNGTTIVFKIDEVEYYSNGYSAGNESFPQKVLRFSTEQS
mgnify:CR=1 FL=1